MRITGLGKLMIFLIGVALVGTALWKFAPKSFDFHFRETRDKLREARRDAVATANAKPADPRHGRPSEASGEWVDVPGGLFRSGADAVSVDVPAFRILRTEVTNASFARFLVAPHVGHEMNGPGPAAIDLVTAMDTWVEKAQAPDHLVVAKLDPASNAVAFERPACEFPTFARYDGSGDPNKATSFRCSDR